MSNQGSMLQEWWNGDEATAKVELYNLDMGQMMQHQHKTLKFLKGL